jgi:cytochrome c oxidase assembly protein subunit 15
MQFPASIWSGRCAWGALICAFPLILVGGVVTTIGAGMAVQGWWDAEGHFMPFFPLDMWLRDLATFVEHKHRLWGLLVGGFALLAVLFSWMPSRPAPASARWASVIALLAVIGQGLLGGLRVLENSRHLAFAHGGLAQLVFSILAVAALLHRPQPGWGSGGDRPAPSATLWITAVIVYAQIWVGAWYRHGLRGGEFDIAGRFHAHLGLAVVATLAVGWTASRLSILGREWGQAGLPAAAGPRALARWLHRLLGLQLLLGFLAWYGHSGSAGQGSVNLLEVTSAVGHVLVGALLLAALITGALRAGWSRSARPAGPTGPASGPSQTARSGA